jgi:hypothetical protein
MQLLLEAACYRIHGSEAQSLRTSIRAHAHCKSAMPLESELNRNYFLRSGIQDVTNFDLKVKKYI